MILVSGDLRRILKALEDQGFTVDRTKSGHWLIRDVEGRAVATIAGTASDHRSWRNSLSYLRRAGFVWPPHKR